jgi:hypothetical protein
MDGRDEQGGGASRSTDPAAGTSTATDVSLREFFAVVRDADLRFDAERDRFFEERDRRYTEVGIEREKALKIKETADLAALGLAREIQTYKDEKANELREQINSERGLYATKDDLTAVSEKLEATIKPLAEYVSGDRGRNSGIGLSANIVVTIVTILIAGTSVIVYLATHK